jgi:O-antigen ligase
MGLDLKSFILRLPEGYSVQRAGLSLCIIFDTVIETGLIFLIVFTPLAFGAVHIWAYTIMELTVLFLVTVWLIKMIVAEGKIRIPKTPLNIPVILFICLILFQLTPLPEAVLNIISSNTQHFYTETYKAVIPDQPTGHPAVQLSNTISLYPYATKTELLKILTYIGVFFLIIGNIFTDRQKNRLLTAIIATGFLLAVFGLIQYFTWNGKIYWFRELTHGGSPFGPFINRNNFAGYIILIIPVALATLMVRRDKSIKILFGFMTVVMATALFLSLSRGGIFAFLGAMGTMVLLLLFLRYEGGSKKGLLIVGGFLISLLLYLAYIGIDPVIDRVATLTEKETYLEQVRWVVWNATAEIVRDYPFVGTGLDTFEAVFPRYQPLEVSGLRWLDAHNDYLQFMAETGIVGSLIALTFFILFFKRIFSSLNNSEPRIQNYLLIGLLSSVVVFLLSIMFTFNTHIPANALLFAVILSMAVKLSTERNGVRRAPST